jgi:hypothetical protein
VSCPLHAAWTLGQAHTSNRHRFIHKYNAKIDASLLTLPSTYRSKQSSGKATKVDLDGAAISQRLKSLTDATGPPSDPATFTASARSQAYDEYVNCRHRILPVLTLPQLHAS